MGRYLFELSTPVKLKLCIQICLRWYYCSSDSQVITSGLFTPQQVPLPQVILTLPYFFPLAQNNGFTRLLIPFFYKSWSPGFSSSSTRIHPSILGPTVVFQADRSWANLQLSCRTVDGASGHTALSLFHPVGRWLESLLCIVNKQARGAPVQVRCLLSAASHREFFTSQTPGKFSFS